MAVVVAIKMAIVEAVAETTAVATANLWPILISSLQLAGLNSFGNRINTEDDIVCAALLLPFYGPLNKRFSNIKVGGARNICGFDMKLL